MTQLVEQRGRFYLGRCVREDGTEVADAPLWYDARHLTTHAVCVGMTGCGKTALGMVLIEEAALNGIPVLVIDPKGDMANLLLAFPDLLPGDFRPWVTPRGEQSPDAAAEEVAQSWRAGLAQWGIDGARIARLKQRVDMAIYTPGSDAGRPVSILQSLRAPALDWKRDAEALRETIASTVSALLALIDRESDPVIGREHILLSAIMEHAWRAGRDLDLGQLVIEVQKPPFEQLGVLSLEVFYPESERMSLVLALNGLLASTRFADWMNGDPLSIGPMLRAPDGRPRVSILYLAHLSDEERSFLMTLLLEQVRAWLRMQEGTPDLRAVLYVDELYGFMPPYPANPPTKAPLLALLKQARSQGMGVVLATQNPVDLDYKGLSNAGTWFVGKLQTANDRERVLEGLRDASLEAGTVVDRGTLDARIARLQARTFLLHNVHEQGTTAFRTRHAMSYLCGPLTRTQIRALVDAQDHAMPDAPRPAPQPEPDGALPRRQGHPGVSVPAEGPRSTSGAEDALSAGMADAPPVMPAGIREQFMPVSVPLEWAVRAAEADGEPIIYLRRQLVYRPALYAQLEVRIESSKHQVRQTVGVSRVVPVPERDVLHAWDVAPIATEVAVLDDQPAQGARFAPLPTLLTSARQLQAVQRDAVAYAQRETALELAYHPGLKLTARPGESLNRFRRRCFEAIEAKRDAALAQLEKSYQAKLDRLEARARREERELEMDEQELEARKREELISAGESVLNLLSRRRQSRMLSVASRKRRMTRQAQADVEESLDALDDLERQVDDLLDGLERDRAAEEAHWSDAVNEVQMVTLTPNKSDVYLVDWGVVWLPYWDIVYEENAALRKRSLAAFGTPGMSGS